MRSSSSTVGVRQPLPDIVYPSEDALRRYLASGSLTRQSLAMALIESFERHAGLPAIAGPEGELSYGALDERSDRLAAALLDLGIVGNHRAMFQMANSAELIVATIACLKIGVIPVCTLVNHREHEIRQFGRSAETRLWFVHGDDPKFDLTAFADTLRADIPSVAHVIVARGAPRRGQLAFDALIAAQTPGPARTRVRAAAAALDPFQAAVFQLSGGTTGLPKIIPRFSHEYLYNMRAVLEVSGRDSSDVVFSAGPFLHNAGFGGHWGPGLLSGSTVLIGRDLSEDGILDLFLRYKPTHAYLPRVLVLRLAAARERRGGDLSFIRTVTTGGTGDIVARHLGVRPSNVYGMAEGIAMMTRRDDPPEVLGSSVGRPLSADDEVRIVAPGTVDEVKGGETGELLARGPYTLHGYFQGDEASRASFTADGFLRTGDLFARQTAGTHVYYEFKGRVKDIVKRAGESINCAEVELLLRTHPAIADVMVVPVPDEQYGERACACVIAAPGATLPTVPELGAHLRAAGLATFKWPEHVLAFSEFPATVSGKPSKPLVRDRARERIAAATTDGAAMPGRLALNGVHHSARPTWRLKETVEFYRDRLGLKLVHAIAARGWGREGHPDFLHFFFDSGAGSTIAFFYYLGTQRPAFLEPQLANHNYRATHTAWQVATRDELVAWKQRLEANGIKTSPFTNHDVIESIYFDDPNGYSIEITVQTRPFSAADAADATRTLDSAIAIETEHGGVANVGGVETIWQRKARRMVNGEAPPPAPSVYVLDVPEYRCLIDHARARSDCRVVASMPDYLRIDGDNELVFRRKELGVKPALWYGLFCGGLNGTIAEFDRDTIRIVGAA